MTLEQLMSPKVTEWIDNYNKKLNEGQTYSDDKFFEEFDEWFVQNEKEINESLKSINEGKFDDLFDDDDEGEGSSDDRKTEIEDDPDVSSTSDDDSEPDIPADEPEEPEDEEPVSHDPRAKHKVNNSKNPRRNVFSVVNTLYEKICKEGKNMDKVTYLKFLDTSDVNDMTALLAFTNLPNADLSSWNTGGVIHMEGMFYKSTFNNDSICNWNVSSCADFKNMFLGSKFNQPLTKWKPKMIRTREVVYDDETGEKKYEEVEKRAPLPFVGAYEDEEKEIETAFWDDKFKDGIKENRKSKYSHFMDFETFMINEGLWDKTKDFVKKGVDKVKSLFKVAAIKLNNYFVSFIGEGGESIPATNPYTTLNYISSGEVQGVTCSTPVKNDLLNSDVPSKSKRLEKTGWYGYEWGDREKENLRTFYRMLKEHKEQKPFDIINEDRVGFSASSGGLKGIADIDSEMLKDFLEERMLSTPGTRGNKALGAMLIWGAPGVGKSTIPNTIIDEYNNNVKKEGKGKGLKSLIVAECGDMTADGFALPMPVRMSMSDYVKSRPSASKLAKEIGLTDKELEDSIVVRSDDAPKMWLPCYKPDPDERINRVRMMIANGHVKEYYDDKGDYHVEETTDGGLIMFDEFFRADPQIFKILMQILLNRRYGGFTLGDKWGIIACSNRPNDDEEVAEIFQSTGAVVTTRVTQFNFVPDFRDWKKWAETKGGFDEVTLAFLVQDKDSSGEYINWHNIDPEKHSEGEVAHPTPRSWAKLMNELRNKMDIRGYKSVTEIPDKIIKALGKGTIGEQTTEKYIDFIKNRSESVLNIKKIFTDTSYVIPEPIPTAAEISEKIFNYVEANYSSTELPPVEDLINMYELLNKTYPKSKDNFIKQMHINIIRYLGSDGTARKQIKQYCKLCITRYDIQSHDLE